MNRFYTLVAEHPIWVLLVVFAISAFAFVGLVDPETMRLRLQIDPSVDRLLPEDDPERLFYEHVRHVFGSEESVLVAISVDDVFTPDNLDRITRLTRRFEKLPGAHRVLSLDTAPNLRADEDGLEVRSFRDMASADPAERRKLRDDVLGNPLYRGTLVSLDGRVTAVVVTFKGITDREFLSQNVAAQIEAIIAEERGDATIWLTGSPILKAATSKALLDGLAFALPAIAALGALVLFLTFGTLRGVVLPLSTIALALVWTLGTVAWLDRPLNLVTTIVPPLIITVGLAYTMHVLAEYYAAFTNETPAEFESETDRIRHALATVGLPVIITGVTTAAGFLALTFSPLPAVREFGVLSAVGVAYTVSLCLSFVPACLGVMGTGRRKSAPPGTALFAAAATRMAGFALRYRPRMLVIWLVVFVVAVIGATRIEVGTHYVSDFRKDNPVRRDYEAINRAFHGANPFYIVVEGHLDDAFTRPHFLHELRDLQEWLEAQPEIGRTTSMVDHLMLVNRSLNEGRDEFFAIPDTQYVAKQLLVFGTGEEIEGYVDSRFTVANIVVRVNVDDSASIAQLLRRIESRLGELDPPLTARTTGASVLVNRTIDEIAQGQFESIGAALLAIYLILAALFTSLRTGALALLPNVLPVAIYFGALGFTGVTLNPTSSLIACIALGIAVDDTLHYLVRFNSDARRTASEEKAIVSALQTVIRPVTMTSVTLSLGFLVLTASELQNQVEFGALAAFTIAVAWLADVTLTPALCAGVRIVTLWDVLTLDLGREPHRSIGLFQGLTLRQARIFALLSDIRELKAGERLIAEGEAASDMFVLIDGTLSVSIDRDGGRRELATLRRGEVVGEVGHFARKRTANVDAETDARLLRFTEDDLERILNRYPKIAAHLYRNLNEIQAVRLADTTGRMH